MSKALKKSILYKNPDAQLPETAPLKDLPILTAKNLEINPRTGKLRRVIDTRV